MDDPRLLTALGYFIVGIFAIGLTLAIRWTHPINRVFKLGPFVTEEGLRVLLKNVRLVFALGLFAIASGASRLAYWLDGRDEQVSRMTHIFGLAETGFALWAAGSVLIVAWRLCRKG